jgi:hypothetical protein
MIICVSGEVSYGKEARCDRWCGGGTKAAAKARRCDPEMEIVIYQEEGEISYAGCGLPYYISGVIEKRDELISRTPGKFSRRDSGEAAPSSQTIGFWLTSGVWK